VDPKLALLGVAYVCMALASGIVNPEAPVFENRQQPVEMDRHASAPPPCAPIAGNSRGVSSRQAAAGPEDPPQEFADRSTPLSGEGPATDEPRRGVEFVERAQPCVAAPPPHAPLDERALLAAAPTGESDIPEPASAGLALGGAVLLLAVLRRRR
jgi:hypothetical protein